MYKDQIICSLDRIWNKEIYIDLWKIIWKPNNEKCRKSKTDNKLLFFFYASKEKRKWEKIAEQNINFIVKRNYRSIFEIYFNLFKYILLIVML